jgi:hypothetical protein
MALAPAQNRRTSSAAAIKRASSAGRRDMNRLDRAALDQLDKTYRRVAADMETAIRSYAGTDGNLRLEVMQDLLAQVNLRLQQLSGARDSLLGGEMMKAAQIGVRPYASVSGDLTRLADEALRFTRTFVAADGLQLSDRLWRLDQGARERVTGAVQSAIIQGHSASQAANEFLAQGIPVPADIAAKLGIASATAVASASGAALLFGEGNPRQAAMRVFRTELNRSHGEAYRAGAFEQEDVVGTQYLLSPNHPERDICDMHASANRYGLGPGVYPKGKSPWPAHPNTLSYEVAVFADEVTESDREGKEDRIAWLKRQPPETQQGVLGSQKKRAALLRDQLREGEIATPWNVLKKRMQRRGVDVEHLKVPPVEPIPPSPQPAEPAGSRPVSDGLIIKGYKQETQRTLAAIDRVHDDGSLDPIPVKRSSSKRRCGAYRYAFDSSPVSISISSHGDHKELTLAHEIGHFLDHNGIKTGPDGKLSPGFSSLDDSRFDEWRDAVSNSLAVGELRELRDGPARLNGEVVRKTHVRYLLQTEELWARSYAQHIATRGREPAMLGQLREIQNRRDQAAVYYSSQWDDGDFKPIAKAINRLFTELGW